MAGRAHATPASGFVMVPMPEAQRVILEQTLPVPPEKSSLSQAMGRVLAEDVVSREDVPGFDASIKDGYAVVSSDGPGEYPVVAECRAGPAQPAGIKSGEIAYITTGAPLPPGADAVVMVENTRKADGGGAPGDLLRVAIGAQAEPGLDVRPRGADVRQGDRVLSAGTKLGPAEIGLLAMVGVTQVAVHGRPRCVVMSTGDEVVDPSAPSLRVGQVRDSNRVMLCALCEEAGGAVEDMGIIGDRMEDVERAFSNAVASGADVVITSGGVSMGDRDHVKPVLQGLGTIHFGKVLMKPGKPLTYCTVDVAQEGGCGVRRIHIFGLPGNPVSSFVTFHLAVGPCIRKLAGGEDVLPRRVQAVLSGPIKQDPARPEYHRVHLAWQGPVGHGAQECMAPESCGHFVATSTGGQASSRLASAATATGLVEVPRGDRILPTGTVVNVLLVSDARSM